MNSSMGVYKVDWEEARQRMTAWWDGKKIDRPVAYITAPVTKSGKNEYINRTPEKYIDRDTVFNNLDNMLERTYWCGEAFPWHFVYFGPMFFQTLWGSEPHFRENTTWYDPCFESIDDLLKFKFNEDNKWWQLIVDITSESAKRSQGRYLTSIGGLSAFIDMIAGLIGNEKTLIAMMDEPEKLKAARDSIAAWSKSTYDKLYGATRISDSGTIDWLGVWSPKRLKTTQCDLSVMISPGMFNEFVKDDLLSSYDFIDHGLYHLDGEEEIRHLDIILSIEKIKIIQWIPCTKLNQPEYSDPMNWISLFRKIQEAGKSVLIYCPPGRVSDLLKKIDRDKVFLCISCPDAATADKTLLEIEKASR